MRLLLQKKPNLDIKEIVKGYIAAESTKNVKFHAKNLIEEKVDCSNSIDTQNLKISYFL